MFSDGVLRSAFFGGFGFDKEAVDLLDSLLRCKRDAIVPTAFETHVGSSASGQGCRAE